MPGAADIQPPDSARRRARRAGAERVSTSARTSSLWSHGEDYSRFGPDMLIGFQVKRLTRPSVLWLNHRWLIDLGIDVNDEATLREVEDKLLRDFAVAAPAEHDPLELFSHEVEIRFADRYGLSCGGWHGGSGRCGILGAYNGKGMGRTPLVSPEASPDHSTGMMFVAEAICETIASEVAHAELPYGAVPVVAIIDMGFCSPVLGSGQLARRAIMIRPNFIRPAHFERSIFFGEGGKIGSPQHTDAKRVAAAVAAMPGLAADQGRSVADFLKSMYLRFAQQIGAAQAHRLWLGLFSSSNRSIDGALADFGAFRAVSSWRSVVGKAPEQFGLELSGLQMIMESLDFYVSKFLGPTTVPDAADMRMAVQEEARRGFASSCCAQLDVPVNLAEEALVVLRAYYDYQQREVVQAADRAAWRSPWLLDALALGWRRGCRAGPRERDVARHIWAAIRADGASEAIVAGRLDRVRRWLLPRPSLFHEIAVPRIPKFVRSLSGDPRVDQRRVARFIDQQISCARRLWPEAPPGLSISAQWTGPGSAALFGFDHVRRSGGTLISGQIVSGCFHAFGKSIKMESHPDLTAWGQNRAVLWLTAQDAGRSKDIRCLRALVEDLVANSYRYPASFVGSA